MRVWLVAALGLLIVAVSLYCAYAGSKPPTPGDPDIVEGQKPSKTSIVVVIGPPGPVFPFTSYGVWFYRFGEPQSRNFEKHCARNEKGLNVLSHHRWLRR